MITAIFYRNVGQLHLLNDTKMVSTYWNVVGVEMFDTGMYLVKARGNVGLGVIRGEVVIKERW